jgi:hypothetical protein
LCLDKEIEPYNIDLKTMSLDEKKVWADCVFDQLKKETNPEEDKYIFLAGEQYRKYLEGRLTNVCVPMKGLRIGEQKQWLSDNIENTKYD